jgi:hypothetical protein
MVKILIGYVPNVPRHEDACCSGGMAPPFLTWSLDGGERSASRPCPAPGTLSGWAQEPLPFPTSGIEPRFLARSLVIIL